METNQFFSLKRFYLLLRNDLLINYKTYLFTIIGAFIVGFVIFYINMPTYFRSSIFDKNDYMEIVAICLLGLGVFIGLSFPEMSNKIKTTNFLLLPASTFEKFLVQFSIRIIGGILLFLLIIWLDAHLARWAILNIYKGLDPSMIRLLNYSETFKTDNNIIWVLIFSILSMGTYLFSIRLFFKKNALVKTVISFGLIIYIMVCLMVIFSHIFYPETTGFNIELKEYQLEFDPSFSNIKIWAFSSLILSGLFLLPLGYFKFKEKQV